MRITIIVLAGLLAVLHVKAADDKQTVKSVLRSAVVYRAGAELVHTTRVTFRQGSNDITVEGLSNKVDVNSIRIGSDAALTIMSVEYATDFLKPVQKAAAVKKLEDSLEVVNKELDKVQVVMKTNQELLELLKANKQIGGTQTGLSVAELTKMMDYYRSKTLELQQENTALREKEAKLIEASSKLGRQIREEEQKNTKTIGKLNLQVLCPMEGTYNLTISYITPAAYWIPAYDVRVENISKPAILSYKAKLVQTTGVDWQQIKLSLATAIPNQNNNAPVIRTWFLSYVNPLATVLQGRVSGLAAKQQSLDEVVVTGYSVRVRGTGTLDDEKERAPLYVVNGAIVTENEFKKIDPRAIKTTEVLKDNAASALYGSRASNGAVVVTLKDELSDYVAVNDNELNVTFDIDLPYDVPGNGKEQQVKLREYTVPAQYRYFAAPSLDKDAYLLANLKDWAQLNLLPGDANIIVEGTYIGKTQIDPHSTNDTLQMTLGKDKRVVITRQKLVDYSSVKFLGSNKKQTFTYEITVKNNKKEKIELELKDQYPVSSNKDIEVELLQSDGASVNNETGILTWKTELAPGESKKYRISYSAKYPKDKVVNLN